MDAGVELSEEAAYVGEADDEVGATVLCAWLNANVATTFIEVRIWENGGRNRGRGGQRGVKPCFVL